MVCKSSITARLRGSDEWIRECSTDTLALYTKRTANRLQIVQECRRSESQIVPRQGKSSISIAAKVSRAENHSL